MPAVAITMLNIDRFNFFGLELSGIKVDGAQLPCSVFYETNLSGVFLQEVNVQSSIFARSNLGDVILKGAEFG